MTPQDTNASTGALSRPKKKTDQKGKMGRNPFERSTLKVGQKKISKGTQESPRAAIHQASRAKGKTSASPESNWKQLALGLRFLTEGALYTLALNLLSDIHKKLA